MLPKINLSKKSTANNLIKIIKKDHNSGNKRHGRKIPFKNVCSITPKLNKLNTGTILNYINFF